jgi:Zonular occludens toxin (Zot)
MISIRLGLLGSGKTLLAIREMKENPHLTYYSNIECRLPNVRLLTSDMIVSKSVIGEKRNGQQLVKFSVNEDFWRKQKGACSVVLDECHSILNPRKSMSNVNIAVTDWLSMLRRVLGENSRGGGDLILITQLPNRVDVIARELCTNVQHHLMHYIKICDDCSIAWSETSETPSIARKCLRCGSINLRKVGHRVEVFEFSSMQMYNAWKIFGMNCFHAHYFVHNVEEYFSEYNSWSWSNLLSSIYE